MEDGICRQVVFGWDRCWERPFRGLRLRTGQPEISLSAHSTEPTFVLIAEARGETGQLFCQSGECYWRLAVAGVSRHLFVASWFRIVQRAWVRVIAVQISVTCGAAEVVGNALNANWPPTIAAGSVKP